MKRWNGWGDETVTVDLPASAVRYLSARIGTGSTAPDATFAALEAQVPASRLHPHRLIATDLATRARHARGHSLPDWVALRAGIVDAFPDGVAMPAHRDHVRQLLRYARDYGVRLIPYGGGTSVVGGINPLPSEVPTLTVAMAKLDDLVAFDSESLLATFGAGILGPDIERKLGERGFTLGHYPQSWEYASLGGWVATRSSGQQSYHYGRIEDLVAGCHIEAPAGSLELPPLPASAAGPDLRHVVLGSEGRLGIITDVTVRVRPLPAAEEFQAAFFRGWDSGVAAVRAIAQAEVPLSMLRLSDPQETETTLVLAGKENLVNWADRGLKLLRFREGRCLLIYGATGDADLVAAALKEAHDHMRAHGGLLTGRTIGRLWEHSRFRNPYLRNTLWEAGYAIDTLETALPWNRVMPAAEAIKAAIAGATEAGPVLVFAHLSHVYIDGASVYVTVLFPRAEEPVDTLRRWHAMKHAASKAILAHGGTISHQHGVGTDHAPYLAAEKGPLGMAWLAETRRTFDPDGIMNPGKLLADAEEI